MRTHAWHRTLGAWLGIPTIYAATLLSPSLGWLIVSFCIYLMIILSVTVGYHRLFTHQSFVCNKFWHFLFAIIGCGSLNSSPVHWAIVHESHHKHADTDKDPHNATLGYFWQWDDRSGLKAPRRVVLMAQTEFHKYFMDRSLNFFVVWMACTALISMHAFIFSFALPVSVFLLISGIHTIFVHRNGKPQTYPIMEFIVPLGGEWLHKYHHDNPSETQFGRFDLGGYLISAIRQRTP